MSTAPTVEVKPAPTTADEVAEYREKIRAALDALNKCASEVNDLGVKYREAKAKKKSLEAAYRKANAELTLFVAEKPVKEAKERLQKLSKEVG